MPVIVEGEGWEDTAEELDDIFIGDAGQKSCRKLPKLWQ